jgi:Protein of unknown function (DUF742)
MGADGKWVDRGSGPVVRPYALTGGRTEPAGGGALDLIAVVVASRRADEADDAVDLTPEHRRILSLCQRQIAVADVASDTGLPVGVVRVLLADLILRERLTVRPPQSADEQPSTDLLQEVLHGLRAL